MAKKTPPRTDFDLGDLIAAGYHQNRQQESASDEPLVGPQTQRIMDGMPAKERGVTGALKDTAVQLAEGANSVLGAIPSLVAPHSRAANFFEKNADYWREAQSDDIKSRTQAASAAIDAADEDGVIAQVVEAARQYSSDPALAARFVVTNLPSLIPGIGAAKVAQAASLAKSARAAGVATKALGIGAKAKAAAAATTVGGLVNAGLNAGGARGDAFTEVKKAAIESGMSEAEAEDLALSKSVMPAVVGGIAGFVSGKTGIERSLFGAGTKKSAAKAATASIVSEMGGEQLEELAPKLATNLQAGEIDGRSLSKDVGRTMVETAIGAGPSSLMAGGVEAIKAAQERKQAAVTSAQASGGIASRAGLAANGHATVPPAAPTQAPVAPVAPVAQTDPSAPVIMAQQEIAAMRSAPELDEAETRRLQFLEENLGDPKTLAELYGMEYNPPPDHAAPPAQPDQATPPEAPATPAGVSASGVAGAGVMVDPETGEIIYSTPAEDGPPPAPMFDERGEVIPDHDPLAGRTNDDLKEQKLNAASGRVKRTIKEELQHREGIAPPAEPGAIDVSETAAWRRNIGKAKKLADSLGVPHKGMKLKEIAKAIELAAGKRQKDVGGGIAGEKINDEWTAFSGQSGTLGIPRAEMPQVKAEHRGAMVNFLKAKGIDAAPETIPSAAVKPTQAEFSPEKVKSAMDFTGGDRAIIVSADGHVVDGHHQWLAKREKGEPIKALRLDANIREVLDALKDMPSAQAEQAASEEQIERDAIQADDAPVAIPQNQDDDIPGFDDLISKPNTVLSAAGDSKQFANYTKWINDGKIVSPGMREQIQSDERLAEGEAGLLLAMVDKRGGENAQPETLESLRAQALAIEDTLDDSKPDPVAEQKLADLRAKIKALKAPEKAKWLKAITDNNRLAPAGAVQLAVTPKGGITFMGDPEATKAGRAMLGAFNAAKDAGATDAEIAEAIKAGRESDSSGPKPAGEVVGEASEVVDAPALPVTSNTEEESNGTEAAETIQAEAQGQEEPNAGEKVDGEKPANFVDGMLGINQEDDASAQTLKAAGFRRDKSKGSIGEWRKSDQASGLQLSILPIGKRFVAGIGYIKKSGGRDIASGQSLDEVLESAKQQFPQFFVPQDAWQDDPSGVDSGQGAKWRKNWAEAKNTAESLGLPTKDGKRNLKLTELVPAIEAKLKQPDSNNEATPSADTSNVIGESANDSIGKQILRAKKTVMRLRTLAKAGDLSLEQKLERKDAVKKAEEALRKMRQNVFSAEDAANAAISAKDASLFAEHKELFPSVYAELAKSIGNPVKASPPASAPTPTPTDAGAPVTSTTLDATNMTPTAVHEALMNGHKLSRHGETVWVGRKTTGTVDSYVVMSKEEDGNMVFTKGPVGASRDIGWGKSEAAEKAIASWDFDTIPVLEAQVAEQDAMLDSVLERLAQQGQVTDGRLEQRRIDLEAMLDKTREQIRAKKALEASSAGAEQQDSLESIFAGLQADGEAKSQAEQKAAASQFASRIEQVEANFHDALIALMEAGTLKVNGQSAITEDNRACL